MSKLVQTPPLWLETPLIRSNHISEALGCSAFLKLENLQPSQSFKYRGLSLFAQQSKEKHGPGVHLIIASGGNAGLAAACAANVLSVRCTVYITEGVSQKMLDFLRKERAEVVIVGKYYVQTLEQAEEAAEGEQNAYVSAGSSEIMLRKEYNCRVMVPAYDSPILWQGHASMIKEIAYQVPNKPDAIFCSVGGGGLLGGVLMGCKDVGWDDIPVVAMETHGSNCFYHSVSVNAGQFNSAKVLPQDVETWHDEGHNVSLARVKKLKSRASSLGASSPAPAVVKMALEREGGVKCVCIPDELTMQTNISFAGAFRLVASAPVDGATVEDHKMLVELACSVTLAPAYKHSLLHYLVPSLSTTRGKTVVFIVCGGFKISLEELEEYRGIVGADLKNGESWEVMCNGEKLFVEK